MTTLRQEIKTAISLACLKDENKLEDGDINWNYVDADVSIDFSGMHCDIIVELLNEVADAYYATIKQKKPMNTALRNIDFGGPLTDINGNSMGQTEESREWLMGQGINV